MLEPSCVEPCCSPPRLGILARPEPAKNRKFSITCVFVLFDQFDNAKAKSCKHAYAIGFEKSAESTNRRLGTAFIP
ncbi:MAG: hypothetical protein CMM07_08995 [Rhodopirellula sp.]|nr:hypothetical protein [Rhodopirellula sp.]